MTESIRINLTVESDEYDFVKGEDKHISSQEINFTDKNEPITLSKSISCAEGLPASLIPYRLF